MQKIFSFGTYTPAPPPSKLSKVAELGQMRANDLKKPFIDIKENDFIFKRSEIIDNLTYN